MPTSVRIYDITEQIDIESISEGLQDYEHYEGHPDVDGQLLTDITEVQQTSSGVEFVVRFDEPLHIGHRPTEPSCVKNTVESRIRLSNNLVSSHGFLTFAKKSKLTRTIKNLAEILDIDTDACDHQEISSGAIERIVGNDSIDATFGWWEDIGPNTSKASVQGTIEDSTHAQNIDRNGNPTWVIFTSDQFNKKVGVGEDGVVFYEGWTTDEMEQYIVDVIIPEIN